MSLPSFPFGLRAHDYGRHGAAALAGILASRGASHTQLAPSKALAGVDEHLGSFSAERAGETAEAFLSRALSVSVLGCCVDLLSPDPERRDRAHARFLEALERAPVLRANLVATESFRPAGATPAEENQTAYLKALEPIAERAEALGVDFALEPAWDHIVSSPLVAARILASLGSSRLYIVLDPVNLLDPAAVLALPLRDPGPVDPRTDARRADRLLAPALECLDRFGDRVRAVHLKDFALEIGRVAVVPPGRGAFPFETFFRAAADRGLRCPCIVENCPPDALDGSLAVLDAAGAGLVARQATDASECLS